MKKKYDVLTFTNNFKNIISDCCGIDASLASYMISPIFDPKKSETGEDSTFRLIVLSEKNIGQKRMNFENTLAILTSFESLYPTKIEVARIDSGDSPLFEIKCSTRIRKPSAIANIDSPYAPFVISVSKKPN